MVTTLISWDSHLTMVINIHFLMELHFQVLNHYQRYSLNWVPWFTP